MDSINKQKKYLSENLIVESLRMYGSNKEEIKDFIQAKCGNAIAKYLNDNAWSDDCNNDTRIFLIRDKNTRKIAYYYALNCGLIYKDINRIKMSLVEEGYVEKLIKALRKNDVEGLSSEEKASANELLVEAYASFDEIEDPDRATLLVNYAQEQAKLKQERQEAVEQIGDSEYVKSVQETYPAIDIKFLCKDANYKPEIELDFKLGVYVFSTHFENIRIGGMQICIFICSR